MKIIVDTNIVFSVLLNTRSILGDLLLNTKHLFSFYSCYLLREEIQRHSERLLKLSGMTRTQLEDAQFHVYSAIRFVSEEQFPYSIWQTAIPLVRDVDMDDVAFVALTEYLQGTLWTGDRTLTDGLKAKGYSKFLTTKELMNIRREEEDKRK